MKPRSVGKLTREVGYPVAWAENLSPTQVNLSLVSIANEISLFACKCRTHRAACNAIEHNGMEGSVAYCARQVALARERSIDVNGCTEHLARPPC